jgi:hypothetical protein
MISAVRQDHYDYGDAHVGHNFSSSLIGSPDVTMPPCFMTPTRRNCGRA